MRVRARCPIGRILASLLLAAATAATVVTADEARAARTIAPAEFVASPGAVAYRAGDFEQAVAAFRALSREFPDDPLVWRFLAMSLDRLGRFEEAIAAYGNALRAAPDDVATLFFRAVTRHKMGDGEAAAAGFRRVVELAPETPYGNRSREFLAGLTAGRERTAPVPRRKDWDGYVQAGAQYDDNVPAAPGGSTEPGVRFYEYAGLGYDVWRAGGFTARVEGTGYLSHHTRAEVNDFDVQQAGAALDLSYAWAPLGVPMLPRVRYDFRKTYLEATSFSTTHEITTSVRFSPLADTATRLYHAFAIERFREDGFNPGVTSRDAGTNTFGGTQYLYFLDGRVTFALDYGFKLVEADGDNFDSVSHDAEGRLAVRLPWQLTFDLSGGAGFEDFVDFNAAKDRETKRYSYGAGLSRPIFRGLSATLAYSHLTEDSNFRVLRYNRDIVSLALGYRF